MSIYTVPIKITYLDDVTVEADTPEEAKRLALQGPHTWQSQAVDTDPIVEIASEPELELEE